MFDLHPPRLVRGEGEIIEEIVTREKHKDINKVNRVSSVLGEGHVAAVSWMTTISALSLSKLQWEMGMPSRENWE